MPSVAPVIKPHEPYDLFRSLAGLRRVMNTHLAKEMECLRKMKKPRKERRRSQMGCWVVRCSRILHADVCTIFGFSIWQFGSFWGLLGVLEGEDLLYSLKQKERVWGLYVEYIERGVSTN